MYKTKYNQFQTKILAFQTYVREIEAEKQRFHTRKVDVQLIWSVSTALKMPNVNILKIKK